MTDAAADHSQAGRMSRATSLALTLPLVLLLGFAFVVPVVKLLTGSVFAPHATAEHWLRIIDEPIFLRILARPLQTAAIATLLAFLLGYPVALVMAKQGGRSAMLVAACVLIPLWTSVLVRSYAWIVLLQRTGIVNNLLLGAGLIDQPLRLIYTEGAVIVAMAERGFTSGRKLRRRPRKVGRAAIPQPVERQRSAIKSVEMLAMRSTYGRFSDV